LNGDGFVLLNGVTDAKKILKEVLFFEATITFGYSTIFLPSLA